MEIERKFLVVELPRGFETARSVRIRQGYLAVGGGAEVRLRDGDGAFTLTAKSGSGLARGEHEVALTREQFEALWPATAGRRLEKRRYFLESGELVLELDVYEADLLGLRVVEVEFSSLEAADAFHPPGWFGAEVTDDPAYKNAALAAHGRPGAGS